MAGHLAMTLGLVLAAGGAEATHPRLFFSAADLPALREAVEREPLRERLRALERLFERDAAAKPPLPKSPAKIDDWPIEPWTARMVNASFLWALTGDEGVLARAREWLLGLCSIRPAPRNSYSYGFYALALAVGYDVLYPSLTPAERAHVAKQLGAAAQGLYEAAVGRAPGWWRRIYLHHDYWIPTAGLGVAALALEDEDPRWRTWYGLARRELGLALALLGGDGAWHEGVSGWCYAMAAMLPFLEASRRAAGDDLYRSAPWLRNTALWRLYCRLPDGSYFFYGDSFRDGRYQGPGLTPVPTLRLLARWFRDGRAQWLADEEQRRESRDLERALQDRPTRTSPASLPAFYGLAWELLWHDPGVKPLPPDDLPRWRVFENLGYVVARTGWDAKAAVLTFRAGPVTGRRARTAALRLGADFATRMNDSAEHAHMDQNSFTFFHGGTYWVSPPGYGARNSSRHTTLLIGGHQQVKDCRLRPALLRREFRGDYVYLLGDASGAYPPETGLERFHRHLVWLKPGALVVADDVRASRPTTVEWRLHAPGRSPAPQVEGGRLVMRASPAPDSPRFVADFPAPESLTLVPRTRQSIPEEHRQKKSRRRLLRIAYSAARTETPSTRRTFLVVIQEGGNARARPIPVTGGVGALVETPRTRWAVVVWLEPLCEGRKVRLTYTVPPGNRPAAHLVVGLPAAVGVALERTRGQDGSTAVTVSPGTEMETSPEGTLRFE